MRIVRTIYCLAFLVVPSLALAAKPYIYATAPGTLGAGGYDVVTYFDADPQKGSSAYEAQWQGASWRFVSAQNRDKFLANPERYAPQYGGYCAWAVSRNYTASTDPLAYSIVDGKLYLNYNRAVRMAWSLSPQKNIARADENWPDVLTRPE